MDSDCGSDFACNVGPGHPQICVPQIPLGQPCPLFATYGVFMCAGGGFCFADTPDPSTVNGTCTALHSLATESIYSFPTINESWFLAATYGAQLCASSLAVPVADLATGYPTSAFKCVSQVDISREGMPCPSCTWATGSQLWQPPGE